MYFKMLLLFFNGIPSISEDVMRFRWFPWISIDVHRISLDWCGRAVGKGWESCGRALGELWKRCGRAQMPCKWHSSGHKFLACASRYQKIRKWGGGGGSGWGGGAGWGGLTHSEAFYKAFCSILKHSEAFWNILEHFGAFWSILKFWSIEAFRSILRFPGPHQPILSIESKNPTGKPADAGYPSLLSDAV